MNINQATPFDADRAAHDLYVFWVHQSVNKFAGGTLNSPDWQCHLLGESVRDTRRPLMAAIINKMDSSLSKGPYNSIGEAMYEDFGIVGPIGRRVYVIRGGVRNMYPTSELMIENMKRLAAELGKKKTVGLSRPRGINETADALRWLAEETVFAEGSAVYLNTELITADGARKCWQDQCDKRGIDPQRHPMDEFIPMPSTDKMAFDWQMKLALVRLGDFSAYEM